MMSEIALEAQEQEQTSMIHTEDATYNQAVQVHCQVMIAREQILDSLLNIAKKPKGNA